MRTIAILALIGLICLIFVGFVASTGQRDISVYQIGRGLNWVGSPLQGKESQIQVFSDELFQVIAKKQQIELQLVSKKSKTLLENLLNHQVDAILSTLEPSHQNKEHYLFSEPLYYFGTVLIIPQSSTIQSIEEMVGKTVAIEQNSPVLFHIQQKPSMHVITYTSPVSILHDLADHKIDGVLMDQMAAYSMIKGLYPDQLKVAEIPLTSEGIRLVTLKTPAGEKLISRFNEGLRDTMQEEIYYDLLNRWDIGTCKLSSDVFAVAH